jgi:hypothetical protein
MLRAGPPLCKARAAIARAPQSPSLLRMVNGGSPMNRTAACSCGQLRVTVSGKPGSVAACSCIECQRSTGSVFGISSYWPKAAVVAIEGKGTLWRRSSDSGRHIDNYFCPTCGSTLYWYAEAAPDTIGIAGGNFADPDFEPPTYAVWSETKHPWVRFPTGCKEHAGERG